MRFHPLSLGFIVLGFSLVSVAAASNWFSDVSTTHLFYDGITFVKEKGIVEGYADGTFRPGSNINRAEFAKILVGAKFAPDEISGCMHNIESLFTDTPLDAWFTPYICTAFRNNVVSGYPDMSFRPSNSISFAEASKMIKEAYGVEWVQPGPCTASYDRWLETSGSLDDSQNPYWWQRFVCALQAIDTLPPTYKKPDQLLTRAEMADMIYRMGGADTFISTEATLSKQYTAEDLGIRLMSYPLNFSAVLEEDKFDKEYELILMDESDPKEPTFEVFIDALPVDDTWEVEGMLRSSADVIYDVALGDDGTLDIIKTTETHEQKDKHSFIGVTNFYNATNGYRYLAFYMSESGPEYRGIFEDIIESIKILE